MSKLQVYAARPRRDPDTQAPTSVWDYTCELSVGAIVRVGYCAGWVEWDEPKMIHDYGLAFIDRANTEYQKNLLFKAKYHVDGHSSMVDAENCFREFLFDQHLMLKNEPVDPVHRLCAVPGCGRMTQLWATMSPAAHLFYLCEIHHSKEGAALAFPLNSIRRIVASY